MKKKTNSAVRRGQGSRWPVVVWERRVSLGLGQFGLSPSKWAKESIRVRTWQSQKTIVLKQLYLFISNPQNIYIYIYIMPHFITLYKLYAVPIRVCSTREDMHPLWVISSVSVSHILSTRASYPQYPWVISSVPVRICSTHESYPQYPWGYAVPVSHILSTRESYPQYPWGYAVPMSYIGQLWTSFRNKVSQACHKIPEWFKSWAYWQSIWDRVWHWQCWRD